jgi:hypothetical protein
LNDWDLALFGNATAKRNKSKRGKKSATGFLLYCVSVAIFSIEDLISETILNRPLRYDKKMRRLSFRQKNDFQEWKTA